MMILAAVSAIALAEKPNIVFILADDQGFSDISDRRTTMNHPGRHHTPFLEKMSEEGVAFTNMYTNGANCAPTRAAMLSGQYASRPTNNVFNVVSLNRGSRRRPLRGNPDPQGYQGRDALPPTSITMAETLRKAGYTTAYVGKMHVSMTGEAVTRDHGFDFNYGGNKRGHPKRYHAKRGRFDETSEKGLDAFAADYTQEYIDSNIRPYADDKSNLDQLVGTPKHLTDACTDAAIEFLSGNADKPMFLFLGQYAVHGPLGKKNVRSDLALKYQARGNPGSYFGALLEGMDQSIARIVDYLETTTDPRNSRSTLADNTVVFYTSDNGGRLPASDNGPFRGQKGEYLEGGIRVPFIAWSRNRKYVKPGHINNVPAIGTDLYTTFASLAGAELPEGYPLDGEVLSGLLAGDSEAEETLRDRDLFWHFPGYLYQGPRRQTPESIIRSGALKLVYNYEKKSYTLYNVVEDLGESVDLLASDDSSVFETAVAMSKRLVKWLKRVSAPFPIVRSTGESTGPPEPLSL